MSACYLCVVRRSSQIISYSLSFAHHTDIQNVYIISTLPTSRDSEKKKSSDFLTFTLLDIDKAGIKPVIWFSLVLVPQAIS